MPNRDIVFGLNGDDDAEDAFERVARAAERAARRIGAAAERMRSAAQRLTDEGEA